MYLLIILKLFFNKFIKRRILWHRKCFHNVCQVSDLTQKFISIIPHELESTLKKSNTHFTRNRELPLQKLITFTLSLAASGTNRGVDIKSGHFFKNARRSGLWFDTDTVHRSSITKARQKVPWQVFQNILSDAVKIAYDLWPENDPKYLWHGMSVYATDGSKYNLPATETMREEFDRNSGLQNKGKGHYPQCMVSTLYDVFRRLPIARTIVKNDSSEREEIKKLKPFVPPKSVWLFDRGYPSYETIFYLEQNYDGYYVFRSPASSTFSSVEAFIKSGKKESIIWITPSGRFKSVSIHERKDLKPIKLRVLRLESPDGVLSVILTNLLNKKKYDYQEIIDLYFRRWEVEVYYRDEKVTLEIEKFHSKTINGILQEFYAAMIMSVISRTLMVLSSRLFFNGEQEFQFKNAVLALASEAAIFVPDDPEKAVSIFQELLHEIARVKYYRPKVDRPTQLRINKRPLNKWNLNKQERIKQNA